MMDDKIEYVDKLLELYPYIEIIPKPYLDDCTVIPANDEGEFFPMLSTVTRLYVSMDVFDVLRKE